MKYLKITLIILAFLTISGGVVRGQSGGDSTVGTIDQWKATTTPYSAITPRTTGKNIYAPASIATTSRIYATTFCIDNASPSCITSWPSGSVTSVFNSDGTLNISPTTGDVEVSVNQDANFSWNGSHQFNGGLYGDGTNLTGVSHAGEDVSQFVNDSGYLTSISGLDHGLLGGLTDDDHAQYALLIGRSGGQSLIGGTASGNNLTLRSTSNATRGKIIFGNAGTSVYDEVNERWGFASTTPTSRVVITGTGASTAVSLAVTNSSHAPTFSVTDNGRIGVATTSTANASFVVGGTPPNWTTAGATAAIQLPNNSAIKWAANGSSYRWGVSQFTGGLYWQQNSADTSATPLYRQWWSDDGSFNYFGGAYPTASDLSPGATLMSVNGRGVGTVAPFLTMTHLDDNDSAKNMGFLGKVRANGKYMYFGQTMGQNDNSLGAGVQGIQSYYAYQFPSRTFTTPEAPTVLTGWDWRFYNGSAIVPIAAINVLASQPAFKITKANGGGQFQSEYDSSNYWNASTTSNGSTTFNAVGAGAAFVFEDSVDIRSALRVDSITNDTGLASGVLTSTLVNAVNMGASTAYEGQYMRVGNTVTYSFKIDVDPTAPAASTIVTATIPVASNFGAAEDASGTCYASGIAAQGAAILASTTADTLQMQWVSADITNQPMYCTATYQVI